MAQALVNARVLLPEGFADGRVVLVQDGRIAAIVTEEDARIAAGTRIDLGGALLVPGFIDCHVHVGAKLPGER